MKIHTHSLRVLHKWIGLIIGLQFVLWTLSGAGMALLDMEQVSGGSMQEPPPAAMSRVDGWPRVQQLLGGEAIQSAVMRPLHGQYVYEVTTDNGVKLFNASSGDPVVVDARAARQIAQSAYPGSSAVRSVGLLSDLTLEVREHGLPIWRVDFDDAEKSSYYVSGTTGAVLERRNDMWRTWDFLWMLHNMDYSNRTSFNHPLIIMVGFAAVWLAITGLWLLTRTGWRADFKRLRSRRR